MTESARIQLAYVLSALLHQAEDWITADMAERHEEYLASRREREQGAVDRGKPRTRHTGKTERDREKRRNRQRDGA